MNSLGSIFWPRIPGSRYGAVSAAEGQCVLNRGFSASIVVGAFVRVLLQSAPPSVGSVAPWIAAVLAFGVMVAWGRYYYRATGAKLPSRVLILDDDGPTRESLERLIRRRGWDVDPAATVAEAVGLLSRHPSVIVVDVRLASESGLDVFAYVRGGANAPRSVVVTAATDPEILAEIRAVRPSAVFSKPVADWSSFLDCLGDPFGD